MAGHDLALRVRPLPRLFPVLAAALLLAPVACTERTPPLRVLAAASLTDVVEALAPHFPGARVEASFGASSALARQIRDGAPGDVFLSASPEWIESLREADALAGAPVVLARNRLVCVAGEQGSPAAAGVTDPGSLLSHLGGDGRAAIADRGVPAGEYARASLEALGLLDAFEPRLVGLGDVRAVLRAVESGELPAGFVYATDARTADVTVLFSLDPATHPPIEYQAAVLRGAAHPAEARAFLEFLHGDEARDALSAAGFEIPGP
ncbi:MAG TPA: molybdate ABC transporter substrate-binding protein [bacterium]|nr:molybdate ABC transporter substrate-binding protein [bacterium]